MDLSLFFYLCSSLNIKLNNMEDIVHKLFICSCNSVEHQLIMTYFTDDDGEEEVYCSVHLKPESNIFKRVWKAVKYIFGHRSIYGDFDEFIFKPEDADSLQQVVDYLKNSIKAE